MAARNSFFASMGKKVMPSSANGLSPGKKVLGTAMSKSGMSADPGASMLASKFRGRKAGRIGQVGGAI